MSEQDCQRNLRLIYLYTGLINFMVILPVIIPYYRDVMGLSFRDFLIIESVFSATLVLLDVPTGWLADVWGRKKCLMASTILSFLGFGCLYFSTNFWQAAFSEILLGIHVALASGANSALLYDTLLSQNREHEYKRREGLRISFQFYGTTCASILGGYLYTINFHFPLQVQLVFILGACCTTCLMIEPPRHKIRSEKHPLADIRETMIYALHGHRQVAGLIVLMMLLFSTTKICLWSLQAYMAELKLPESINGWAMAGVMLVAAMSAQMNHKIFPTLKGTHALQILLGILILFLLIAGWKNSYLGLVLLSLEGFFFAYGMPRAQEAINRLVDSRRRATILSTASLMVSLAFIPTSQVLGYATDHGGIGNGLLVHAGLLALIGGGTIYYTSRSAYKDKVTETGT